MGVKAAAGARGRPWRSTGWELALQFLLAAPREATPDEETKARGAPMGSGFGL
jgi:hypothetical protein